jgi:hypothetical protein
MRWINCECCTQPLVRSAKNGGDCGNWRRPLRPSGNRTSRSRDNIIVTIHSIRSTFAPRHSRQVDHFGSPVSMPPLLAAKLGYFDAKLGNLAFTRRSNSTRCSRCVIATCVYRKPHLY